LPGRRNVVISRDGDFPAPGAEVATSLPAALVRLQDAPRVFVVGGAQIYAQALPLATELLLTEIDADLPGDAHFPPWDRCGFEETQRRSAFTAEGVGYHFVCYRRR
jgi:dihydrofolate reductase